MIFNIFGQSGRLGVKTLVFDGSKLTAQDGADWDAALLTSGVLIVRTSVLVDMALVAGGMPGQAGGSGLGGVGGKGGGIALFSGIRLRYGVTYTVTIGGSGQNTTITGSDGTTYTAVSGDGADGGQPSSTRGQNPTDGSDGTQIWGGETLIEELAGRKFGPGGGAGAYCSADYSYYSGSDGGEDGGGDGGNLSTTGSTQATSGADNTGSGGGGAFLDASNTGRADTPGLGGSGIAMVRNHREVAA